MSAQRREETESDRDEQSHYSVRLRGIGARTTPAPAGGGGRRSTGQSSGQPPTPGVLAIASDRCSAQQGPDAPAADRGATGVLPAAPAEDGRRVVSER